MERFFFSEDMLSDVHTEDVSLTVELSLGVVGQILPAVALKQENKSLTRSILVTRTCWSIQL